LEDPIESYSAREIYDKADSKLKQKNFMKAAEYYGEIERLYPYSEWAKRGLIMQAFSFHQSLDYPNTRSAAQRYLDFYPAADDAAYAQYLLALSYYDQIDEIGRDQGVATNALEALRVIIDRYPNSEYSQVAKLKFDRTLDHLATKEMEVGRYYLEKGHYTAAVNRFRIVIEDFKSTNQTPEALHRLVESYISLGLTEEAQSAGAVLKLNYKSTDWYNDTKNLLSGQGLKPVPFGGNWLVTVYRQMIKGQWL
jgi:outer membrane protein assembly factor BamD